MNMLQNLFSTTLETFVGFTGDWFIAVVILTFIVKLIFFPLSIKQQRSIFLTQNLNEAKIALGEKYKKKNEKINECLAIIMEKYKSIRYILF